MEIPFAKVIATTSFIYFNARLFTQQPLQKSWIDRLAQRTSLFNKKIKKAAQDAINRVFRQSVHLIDSKLEGKPVVALWSYFWLAAFIAAACGCVFLAAWSWGGSAPFFSPWKPLFELISGSFFSLALILAYGGASLLVFRLVEFLSPFGQHHRYWYLWPFVAGIGYVSMFFLIPFFLCILLVWSLVAFFNYVQRRPNFNFLDFMAGLGGIVSIWL